MGWGVKLLYFENTKNKSGLTCTCIRKRFNAIKHILQYPFTIETTNKNMYRHYD